jgi:hypothetical protein
MMAGPQNTAVQTCAPVRVGLLGAGTVGAGTFAVLARNADEIARRAGRAIQIVRVADAVQHQQARLAGKQRGQGGEVRRHRRGQCRLGLLPGQRIDDGRLQLHWPVDCLTMLW